MKIWRLLALALSLFASAPSSAAIVYQWINVDSSPTIASATGTLGIPDDAFSAGSWRDQDGRPNPNRDPARDFYYSFTVTSFNSNSPTGYALTRVSAMDPYASWDINVTPLDALLVGYIFIDNGFADTSVYMSSNANGLWTINLASGPSNIWASGRFCSGATGYWVRVPEPPALLLLSIGLLAFIATRRRLPIKRYRG